MSWFYKKEKKQHKTVYRILGLKISVKHSEETNLIMGLDELLRKTIDVTTLPKAQGFLRDIQLALLKMLLEVDKVCKEKKVAIEINGYGILKNQIKDDNGILRYQYPYSDFWQFAKSFDIPIICNSDAHSPEDALYSAYLAEEYAKQLGITPTHFSTF